MMSNLKIMAVDDEPFNLEVLQELISSKISNIDFLMAESGDEALSILKSNKPS